MFNLQDAMAGSQLDSLLGRTLVDEAEKLHVATKLHSNRVSVPTLLLLSDNELGDLFPAASLGAKLGFKTAIRFQKESVAPPVKLDLLEWLWQQLLSKQFFFGGRPSFSAREAEDDEMRFRVQKWDVFPEINAYLESQAAGEKRFPLLIIQFFIFRIMLLRLTYKC